MSTNTKFPLNIQILNISSNLTRIGEWVSGDYKAKLPLIDKFISQTTEYLSDLKDQTISKDLKKTIDLFSVHFQNLKDEKIDDESKLRWAEKSLTWANILQHKSKLT